MIYSSGPLARNTTPASLWRIGSLKRAVSFGQDEGSAWPTLPAMILGKVEGTERTKIRYIKTDANSLESVKASRNKEGNSSRAFGPTIGSFPRKIRPKQTKVSSYKISKFYQIVEIIFIPTGYLAASGLLSERKII